MINQRQARGVVPDLFGLMYPQAPIRGAQVCFHQQYYSYNQNISVKVRLVKSFLQLPPALEQSQPFKYSPITFSNGCSGRAGYGPATQEQKAFSP